MSQVTVKDIALKAGVSVGTVSKVINGGICKSARHLSVLKALEEMNYTPNVYARATRCKRSNCIGVLLEEAVYATSSMWLEGYLMDLLQEISAFNYRCTILSVNSLDENFNVSQFNQFDGLISFGHFSNIFWEKMQRKCKVPLVTYFENTDYDYGFSFVIDLKDAMQKMAQHLYDFGHKNIVFATDNSDVAKVKMNAFQDAMSNIFPKYKRNSVFTLQPNLTATEAGTLMTEEILKNNNGVTTIFYVSDSYANGGICSLMQHKLCLARDISIVSYDHTNWASNFTPKITGVGLDRQDIVKKLISYLHLKINKENNNLTNLKDPKITLKFFEGQSVKNLSKTERGCYEKNLSKTERGCYEKNEH